MKNRRPDALWVYALCVLLTLVIHLADHKSPYAGVSTVLFGCDLLLESGMLLWWLVSVRRRLLPSRARAYITAVAVLFLFFLAVSTVNYRVADQNDLFFKRCCWYLYYIPLLGVPALFLSICLSISPLKKIRVPVDTVCLTVSGALAAVVLTNDLHRLVFVPEDPSHFVTAYGYSHGTVYYVGAVFVALEFLLGAARLILLSQKRRRLLLVFIPLLLLLLYRPISVLEQITFRAMFLPMPYYVILCMASFFEACIRFRLIPYNENYTAFFANMRYPAVITDKALAPVYRTAAPLRADPARLRETRREPVYLSPDLRLSGKRLKAGNVFYAEDESELHRMNERLTDANEMLESEHTLIRAENELREQRARLESRGSIYSRISQKTLSRQTAIAGLLRNVSPESPDFNGVIARVSLMNAYIKRSANLLLTDERREEIDGRELLLALEESARYLIYLGIKMEVTGTPSAYVDRTAAFDAYETFESIAEASLGRTKRLYAALGREELRLVAEAAPEALPVAPIAYTLKRSEGLVYYSVPLKGGTGR